MRHMLRLSLAMALLALAAPVFAAEPAARLSYGPQQVTWDPQIAHERTVLTVSLPNGKVERKEFQGTSPSFELSTTAADGIYHWELQILTATTARRRQAQEETAAPLRRQDPILSGTFAVRGGQIVSPDAQEPERRGRAQQSTPVQRLDVVNADDFIVQGSECVGLDCVNNESFGFDTIRLKENNTRIKFDDTSTSAGFSANDWRLTANDSASGGASKFSIEDITGSKVPFTITGGAATNSIFVDSTGRVGLRTSTPVLDLHINTSNTPAIRMEQNNSGGFTAQTWDVAGNEANFFVRDVTGGSRLPFRIRPGAPTSSIDINASGNVGIGTASAAQELTVKSRTANEDVLLVQRSQADSQTILRVFETTAGDGLLSIFNNAASETFRLTGSGGANWLSGTVGINCNASGGFDFSIKSGSTSTTACNTGTFSQIDAGQTQFTASSSRTIKENLRPVQVPDILSKIAGIDVYQYDFIEGAKDRMGLMAEDFHQVFARGSDKMINGQEVEMALWLAVKELAKQNQELRQRLEKLESGKNQ